jgi:hypothetical protein
MAFGRSPLALCCFIIFFSQQGLAAWTLPFWAFGFSSF